MNKKALVTTVVGIDTLRANSAVIEPLHMTVSQFDNQQIVDTAKRLLANHMHQDDIDSFCKDDFSYLEEFTDDEREPSISLLWLGAGVTHGDPILRLHLERVAITPAKNQPMIAPN